MFDLKNKVAIVTGSSRGIGRATAERLAEAGAKVVISSRNLDACEPVAAGIHANGGAAIAIACNISHKEQLQGLVDQTIAEWGQIDILVCNAAVNPHYGPTADIGDAAFDKILGSNLRSTHWLCNMAMPDMAQRESGSVVLIASITGLAGNSKIGTYGISKAAEMQLARNLACEWGKQGIRVNSIAPGLIETDFAEALCNDPKIQAKVAATPLGRVGEPDDIAGVVLFLASDAAKFVTGQTIVADGGALISDPL